MSDRLPARVTPATKSCAVCGAWIQLTKGQAHRRKYCSEECKKRSRWRVNERPHRKCVQCAQDFQPLTGVQLTCGRVECKRSRNHATTRIAKGWTERGRISAQVCPYCQESYVPYVPHQTNCVSDECMRAHAAYRARTPHNAARRKNWQLQRTYGLSKAEWDALFESQGGVCAFGCTEPGSVKGWTTDHDHVTGKVRGILCHPCNVYLGRFEKYDPRRDEYAAYAYQYREEAANE